MKQIYHILAVVLFVTGALLTSCNKVETTPEDNPELTSEAQTIQFTATLAAKGEDPQSKAITPGTDGEDKEILNVAWAAGEIEEKDRLRNWQPPINGQDIMIAFNLTPCRTIGDIKDVVCNAILDGDIENTREAAYKCMLEAGINMGLTPIPNLPEL